MSKKRLSALLTVLFGIIFAGVGVFMAFINGKGFKETEAVITEVREIYEGTDEDGPNYRYEVFVKFTAGGKEYNTKSDYYQAGYVEGKTIKVFYNPENPNEVTGNSKGLGIAFMIAGVVISLVGVVLFLRS